MSNRTGSFEIIEHTADIGISAMAKSRGELFETCAFGMMEIILGKNPFDISEEKINEKRFVEIDGTDDEDLLYGFLSEILYLFDGEHIIPLNFMNSKFEEERFTTELKGIKFEPGKHDVDVEIKAVTFHGMDLKQVEGDWQTKVIFDV